MPELQRILLVEDEPDIQRVAEVALEMIGGFTLQICSSGKEAIDIAASFQPDIIVLDVMMPEMDGPATLIALRKISEIEKVPAIFMTAKVQADKLVQLNALGAEGIIAKPFSAMKLADQIREIWQQFSQ
ncbi:MAG: response regulator [Gammaproteobacteria bacterium]|nr:response regulator [Gammaproteobacteria bacterium]